MLSGFLPAMAQDETNLRFQQIAAEQGLPQVHVISILQDRRGFMWFGTNNGLNRYDGYTFKIFKNNPKDLASISRNIIESLIEDAAGSIWIGTPNGLNHLDPETNRFTHYSHKVKDKNSISRDYIRKVFEDSRKNL